MSTSHADARPLRVAMIGHGFMGAAHSQAWRVAAHFFDLPRRPEMAVLVGRDADRARAAADRLGWQQAATDWRSVVDHDDVDLVDIVLPGNAHAEVALAALAAGKHVLCEKPLANSVAEAEQMAAAAEAAAARGVLAMVGFSYRRVPALALARQLIADGLLGQVRHVRAQYLQDWLSDADSPDDLAAGPGPGRLRRVGRHRGARRGRRPVPDRQPCGGCQRPAAHLRHRATVAAPEQWSLGNRGRPGAGRSPSMTQRCSPPG